MTRAEAERRSESMFFVIGIPFCFVLPCFATGCHTFSFQIATAALRPRNDTKIGMFWCKKACLEGFFDTQKRPRDSSEPRGRLLGRRQCKKRGRCAAVRGRHGLVFSGFIRIEQSSGQAARTASRFRSVSRDPSCARRSGRRRHPQRCPASFPCWRCPPDFRAFYTRRGPFRSARKQSCIPFRSCPRQRR